MSDRPQLYAVNDVYESIQGEGAMTGQPMTILRLQGCDVGCPWCDTKETWALDRDYRMDQLSDALGQNIRWVLMTGREIAAWLLGRHGKVVPGGQWVLVTGGEPAMRPLAELVAALRWVGFKSACETSGTHSGVLSADFDWLCVSPKLGMPGSKGVQPGDFHDLQPVVIRGVQRSVISMADEIKMPVGRQRDILNLESLLDAYPLKAGAVVSLQPISESKEATSLCVETAKRKGWRVSIQVHKLVNLP